MHFKRDERVIKDTTQSFKLSQERKAPSTTASEVKAIWQSVQNIPKVAIRYPKITQKKSGGTRKALNESLEIKTTSQLQKSVLQSTEKKSTMKPFNNEVEPKNNVSKRKVEPVQVNANDKRVKLNVQANPNEHKLSNRPELLGEAEEGDYDSESEIKSASEYSLISDEEFFRKPEVIVCDSEVSSLLLSSDIDKDSDNEEQPWLVNMKKIDATVIKVPVFNVMLPEFEPELGSIIKKADKQKKLVHKTQSTPAIEKPMPESAEAHHTPEIKDTWPELNIFENSLKSNKVLAVLKQDTELYGTVTVTLLCGRITINGYKARKLESLNVYSSKGFNWVVISPKANKKTLKVDLSWGYLDEAFSHAQVKNIIDNYDKQRDAIVLLQRNSGAQNMLSTFSKHMSENVFPLVNVTNRPNYSSEFLLNCLVQSADKGRGLQVPTVWTKLPLKQESRLMITGGKGVGKSTLLRYMLNRHLKQFPRMLLIDLDIGQPELFLPQTVSCTVVDAPLLGPGLFLNKQPDIAFAVGHVNVIMCAEQYARGVRELLSYCCGRASLKGIPWLINTMGYNKGFGKELMALIVDCIGPTDLVQICSTKAINNFDEPLDRQSLSQVVPLIYTADEFKLRGTLPKYTLHHLMSAVPQTDRIYKPWMMSARDVRYSNLLARLSATLHGNAKTITDCRPVQVDLEALQIVHLTSNEYTREELISGIEANIVYLCRRMSTDQPVECVGIGVVRAIDHEANKVYLVPAMPFDRLTKVNCLVICGGFGLPQGFFKDQGACVANEVPYVFVIDDTKSSKSIQQIYHRAPGFLGNRPNKNV